MIHELIHLYQNLCDDGEIKPFLEQDSFQYALEIDFDGNIQGLSPLGAGKQHGAQYEVPLRAQRSVQIVAQFLWDKPSYLLGISTRKHSSSLGGQEELPPEFNASKQLHERILANVSSPIAQGILRFFDRTADVLRNLSPQERGDAAVILQHFAGISDDDRQLIVDGKINTLIFRVEGTPACKDAACIHAWQDFEEQHLNDNAGKKNQIQLHSVIDNSLVYPALTHNHVNIPGGQSAGSALVAFNFKAAESYGFSQCENAPMSNLQQYQYTQALRYLLGNNNGHRHLLGNVVVLFWAEHNGANQPFNPISTLSAQDAPSLEDLSHWVDALSRARNVEIKGVQWSESDPCFFLGLVPNAARISVRFFFRNTFGQYLRNVQRYYSDLAIAGQDRPPTLGRVIGATENPKQKRETRDASTRQLYSNLIQSALQGMPFTYEILERVEERLLVAQAEDSSYERFDAVKAGIIKAFYLRNMPSGYTKEDFSMALNESNNHIPYTLGRLFYVCEWMQDISTDGKVTTLRRQFFSSAASSPAMTFPLVLKLAQTYQDKLERDNLGMAVSLGRKLDQLIARLGDSFPTHLTQIEQGQFFLGYYHQKQDRYTKKADEDQSVVSATPGSQG